MRKAIAEMLRKLADGVEKGDLILKYYFVDMYETKGNIELEYKTREIKEDE